jgi:hypothetical protein
MCAHAQAAGMEGGSSVHKQNERRTMVRKTYANYRNAAPATAKATLVQGARMRAAAVACCHIAAFGCEASMQCTHAKYTHIGATLSKGGPCGPQCSPAAVSGAVAIALAAASGGRSRGTQRTDGRPKTDEREIILSLSMKAARPRHMRCAQHWTVYTHLL